MKSFNIKCDIDEIPCTKSECSLLLAVEHNVVSVEKKYEIYMVLDKSGSMGGRPIEYVKIITELVAKELKQKDKMSVTFFNGNASCPFPLRTMNDIAKQKLEETLSTINAGGNTDICLAMETVLSEIKKSSDQNSKRLVILVTDGDPTSGILDTSSIVKRVSEHWAKGIVFTCFGVGDVRMDLLNSLADETNGTAQHIIEFGERLAICVGEAIGKVKSCIGEVKIDFGTSGIVKMVDPDPKDKLELYDGETTYVLCKARIPEGKNDIIFAVNVSFQSQVFFKSLTLKRGDSIVKSPDSPDFQYVKLRYLSKLNKIVLMSLIDDKKDPKMILPKLKELETKIQKLQLIDLGENLTSKVSQILNGVRVLVKIASTPIRTDYQRRQATQKSGYALRTSSNSQYAAATRFGQRFRTATNSPAKRLNRVHISPMKRPRVQLMKSSYSSMNVDTKTQSKWYLRGEDSLNNAIRDLTAGLYPRAGFGPVIVYPASSNFAPYIITRSACGEWTGYKAGKGRDHKGYSQCGRGSPEVPG